MAPSTPAASPSASAPEGGLPRDTIVESLVEQIALRDDPRLAGSLIGYLPLGSRSFVAGGPVQADGLTWMLLAGPGLPPASGCATFPRVELTCPVWVGWAAIADPATGDSWFADDPSQCPDPSGDSRAIMMLGDVEALHCYSGRELELRGWLPAESVTEPYRCLIVDESVGWLFCGGPVGTLWATADEAVTIDLFVDPSSDVDLSATTGQVTMFGHVDDPAARFCDDAIPAGHPVDPETTELNCRTRFVVDRIGGLTP